MDILVSVIVPVYNVAPFLRKCIDYIIVQSFADFELLLRLIEKNGIKLFYLPEPLVRMRLGGTTSKNWVNIKQGNLECIKAFQKNNLPVNPFYSFYRLIPKLKQFFQ